MSFHALFLWFFVGLTAGWLGGRILSPGLGENWRVLFGVLGGILGGFLFSAICKEPLAGGYTKTMVSALAGAIGTLLICRVLAHGAKSTGLLSPEGQGAKAPFADPQAAERKAT